MGDGDAQWGGQVEHSGSGKPRLQDFGFQDLLWVLMVESCQHVTESGPSIVPAAWLTFFRKHVFSEGSQGFS